MRRRLPQVATISWLPLFLASLLGWFACFIGTSDRNVAHRRQLDSRYPRRLWQQSAGGTRSCLSAGKAPQVDLIFSEDEEDEEEGSFFAELEREEAAKSAEVLTDSGLDADSVEEQLAADLRKRHRMHERAVEECNKAGRQSVFLLGAMDQLFPPSKILSNGLVEGVYVDATFGQGGHAREMLARLSSESRLYRIDIDPEAARDARELAQEDDRLIVFERTFSEMDQVIPEKVDGVLIDPGFMNPQLHYSRGGLMSNLRQKDTRPLDLRFNRQAGIPASEWLQTVTTPELAWVLTTYVSGITPLLADRIAQAIHDEQEVAGPFRTLARFAEVVARAVHAQSHHDDEPFKHPRRASNHPARLVVAALRHFLNQENEQLRLALSAALRILRYRGRCLVLTFKPSEEMNVQDFIMWHQEPSKKDVQRLSPERLAELWPLMSTGLDYAVESVPGFPIQQELTRLQAKTGRSSMTSKLFVLQKKKRLRRRVKANPRPLKSRFKQLQNTVPLI